MEEEKNKWVILNKKNFKNTFLFIALFIVCFTYVDGGEFGNLIVAIALASLIVFVWRKIAKRYLEKAE